MAYLTPAEIKSHLKDEVVTDISEGDASLLQEAIDAAISEMRGYISFYDVDAILATTGTAREPILLMFTKDIAVWHFINLGNANIDMELRETRYKSAISWLKDVQKGNAVPNLPVLTSDDATAQVGKIKYGSTPRRETRY